MNYEKVSETQVKITKQVEETTTVDALKARKEALEESVATLQAEIALVEEQMTGASEAGVKLSADVAVEAPVEEEVIA